MMTEDPILVVSDAPGDARLIKRLLDDDFSNVATSTEASQSVAEFSAHQPRILVLAFDTVQKAEDYYLSLHRKLPPAHSCLHRTVLLCNKAYLQRAYELCRKGQFDDYVIFWPLSFDAPRLHMAIYGALRELRHAMAEARSAGELLSQTQQTAKIKPRLKDFALQGRACMDMADESLLATRAKVIAAMDEFSRQLAAFRPNGSTEAADQSLAPSDYFLSLADAMKSVRHWSEALEESLTPQIGPADAQQPVADSTSPCILVVDDDVVLQKVLGLVLAETGATIVFASSGAEAFSKLQTFSPNLILMDFQLPDMDGAVVIRNIKSIAQYSAIPVIMITGQLDENTHKQCNAAGAVDFVGKPFEADTILGKVRQWLKPPG